MPFPHNPLGIQYDAFASAFTHVLIAFVDVTLNIHNLGDNKIVQKYSGKIDGDTIKGKIAMEGGRGGEPRDWEAKRAK